MIEQTWELSVQEYGGLRHDQAGREVLASKWRRVQVWKHQSVRGVGQRSQRPRHRSTRLVTPSLKVHRFRRADTQQDAQHLFISDPLRQRWVETGATLFDRAKMKGRCVGDCLDVLRRRQVGIGPGNARELPH